MKLAPLAALALLATPALAQDASPPTPASASVRPAPKLIVAISVDQFSADLFAEYRTVFTGGFSRLLKGTVFPSGYQSHAATETCPGHSTILTGSRPARTGIIANDWTDFSAPRADKTVYCAEDERVPGSDSDHYIVSDMHLKVPTLGERMKNAISATRVVSVAGKDRAAVMMGGHKVDELWWWDGKAFVSYAGRAAPAAVTRTNATVAARVAQAQPALDLPPVCQAHDRATSLPGGRVIGTGRFARAAGDVKAFRASPEFDAAILSLATGLIQDMKLGQGATTDIISVGASATDYVGHGLGTEGSEMCLQLLALDRSLGTFFDALDRTGVDYVVTLTADHGGHDAPERNRIHGMPEAQRVDAGLTAKAIGEAIQAKLKLKVQPLRGGVGDVWIDTSLSRGKRKAVAREALARFAAHPQVQAVFTREQIAATPMPSGPPETWTLLQRARASYDPQRSGELLVALKPRITPIANPGPTGSVATHGSIWDYDRRVPILFWRKGMAGFEQPLSIETVDIMPSLAALIGLQVPQAEIDGRCIDLDGSDVDTCAGVR